MGGSSDTVSMVQKDVTQCVSDTPACRIIHLIFIALLVYFETKFHYVTQAGLKLLDSCDSPCLSLLNSYYHRYL